MSTSRSTKSKSPSPVSNGRRSPTHSAASQHPKPKAAPSTTLSSKSTSRSVQPSPAPTAAKRQSPAKKPTEKPSPSPSRRPPQRTLSTPINTRERSPKPPSLTPAPKPKVIGSDKGSKPIKSGATASYSRSKSLEKRREVVASSVDHTSFALDTEVPITKTDIEEKEETVSPIHVEDTPKNDIDSPVGVEEVEEASHEVDTSPHQQQPIEEHFEEHVVEKEGEGEEEGEKVEEKEETTEIDEGPKEPVPVEPVQDTVVEKPAVAVVKEAPVRAVVLGTRKESVQNDVIEEAKSKFLEKRKNKVLALVGAFETVMALQEPEGSQQSQQPQRKGKETEEGSGASATAAAVVEEVNDTVAESTEST